VTLAADIDDRIAAAAAYLSSRRSVDRLWRDFETLAGTSSDWVTAFICFAVRDCRRLRDEVEGALTALVRRQRRNGGWSYNEHVPTDCDSTAWVLLALSTRVMWRPSVVVRARNYVVRHADPSSGGFMTYAPGDAIERYIGANREQTHGWLAPHPCVTSVALQALLLHGERTDGPLLRSAITYLTNAQDPHGLWTSYWWPGKAYNTYFALRALLMARAVPARAAHAVLDAVARDQDPSGGWRVGKDQTPGVFNTSLHALTLLLLPHEQRWEACEAAIAWLLDAQQNDGSWPGRPILRIPAPMISEPDDDATWAEVPASGTGTIVRDQHRLFTTATALWALAVSRVVLRAKSAARKADR
jgi:squalene-hopene/tetraprenyl-beta-curcumene cyclase